MTLLTSFVR